ncbi:unnamed protein product [Cuscuta epithymum]|uniref:Uncharacterized protein n=1 Tax=Cuscuta epithymum TaxID=186058 RepID=A0AAV0GIM0_9ASTE|nr:unnamed protein product [Cuscuta epithymum]
MVTKKKAQNGGYGHIDEVEEPISEHHGNSEEDAVALDAVEAGRREVGGVPYPFLGFNPRPQNPPRNNGADEQGDVDHVRTEHSDADVGGGEVKVESFGVCFEPESGKAGEPTIVSAGEEPLKAGEEEAEGRGFEQGGNLFLGQDGAFRGVEAVDEVRRGGAARVREFELQNHQLPEQDNGEESDEADGEQERRHPPNGERFHVVRGVPDLRLVGDSRDHPEHVTGGAAAECDAGGRHHARLHHRVLLPGEGSVEDPGLG